MSVTVTGGALVGVEALPIDVEVDLLRRLPSVTVVGLAASAVKESAERIRSAIQSAELHFPRKRVVVNLAPADVRKEGTAFDLPIALGILAADGQLPVEVLSQFVAVGELSLAGTLRPIRGALSFALLARRLGRSLLLPSACGAIAALVPDVPILVADTLAETVDILRGSRLPRTPAAATAGPEAPFPDLADVRGQGLARRALEIAAAGSHNLLLSGPPGCGKSMLSQRIPGILPPLTFEEALESTQVRSAAGVSEGFCSARPFRAPHHSITMAGMAGNRWLRPGEVSLAHNGVLFLDEAAEFQRKVLEVLRQPLEDGEVRITRAEGAVCFPARFMLVLATNPCPCGNYASTVPCRCSDYEIARYQRRLSGPILDRIDLHVTLQPVPPQELLFGDIGEDSATVRRRVVAARSCQARRGQNTPNGQLDSAGIDRHIALSRAGEQVVATGATRLGLSGRGTTRLMKVARTIADLSGAETVGPDHVSEALAFRPQAGP